jgi:hypothetical protein
MTTASAILARFMRALWAGGGGKWRTKDEIMTLFQSSGALENEEFRAGTLVYGESSF